MRVEKPADLARLVKTRRQAQGFTQQEIASAVGITRQSLARIERGHAGASFDLVLRIFEQLGIRLEAHADRQRPAAVLVPTGFAAAPTHDAAAFKAHLRAQIEAGDPDLRTATPTDEHSATKTLQGDSGV